MATMHIESKRDDIAPIVLMPGDPNRAKYIADKYLQNAKLVNKVRGILAYTGEYKNQKITVFSSGMGIPSVGIYSYELFNNYDVEKIIRIGTIGAYHPDLNLGDIVIAERAYTDSSFAKTQSDYKKNFLDSDASINKLIIETAEIMGINYVKGNIYTSDVFYEKKDEWKQRRKQFNVLGVEMETFGLLQTAKISNKKAAAIFTVSDSFCHQDRLTSEEREKNLNEMIELALNASLKL